ncbi:MAG: phosphotransferase family protein [Candidatus Thorarchaeota archaeon]
MMRGRVVTHVHGNRPADLEVLLEPELQQSGLHVEGTLLGGMTNINLLVTSDSSEFVLKLPGLKGMEKNPFEYEFSICSTLAKDGLCPEPVSIGFLNDAQATPFMVYRYERGKVHPELRLISPHEFALLAEAIEMLAQQHPSNAHKYSKPSDYIGNLNGRIESAVAQGESVSPKISSLSLAVRELYDSLERFVDSALLWSGTIMHGDLRPSNIVFQDSRALLLDWSECSYGEALLDIAYLTTEPSGEWAGNVPLIDNELTQLSVEPLKMLSLMAAVAWTTERLIRIESAQVEANLADPCLVQAMYSYLDEKVVLLKGQISDHVQ